MMVTALAGPWSVFRQSAYLYTYSSQSKSLLARIIKLVSFIIFHLEIAKELEVL